MIEVGLDPEEYTNSRECSLNYCFLNATIQYNATTFIMLGYVLTYTRSSEHIAFFNCIGNYIVTKDSSKMKLCYCMILFVFFKYICNLSLHLSNCANNSHLPTHYFCFSNYII